MEVEHLVGRTDAAALLTELPESGDGAPGVDPARAFGADELWFLNSTSGTTGLPKVVMHHQARWFAFHELAVRTGTLTRDDVFMSVLPSPFGFGLWTAHFTPAILGAPCVLLDRFTPGATLDAIDAFGVTVLAAVSTQFVMLLESPALAEHDLTSLRVLYTGGERVPADRAAAFEDRTGARVLQFYGSNETGAVSATSLTDDRRVRLETAGRVIPELDVRLFDPDTGADVTAAGGPGIAACRGAVNCLGYWDDDDANAQLFTSDGWMRTGDLCTIAPDGVLTVVGRTSDVIIRGGKNISAAQVEAEVSTHPAVALCAAVAMPDPVFGERVCVYLEVRTGTAAPDLAALVAHLDARGVGKELWPEHVVVVDALPRASGGKIAKAELRGGRCNPRSDPSPHLVEEGDEVGDAAGGHVAGRPPRGERGRGDLGEVGPVGADVAQARRQPEARDEVGDRVGPRGDRRRVEGRRDARDPGGVLGLDVAHHRRERDPRRDAVGHVPARADLVTERVRQVDADVDHPRHAHPARELRVEARVEVARVGRGRREHDAQRSDRLRREGVGERVRARAPHRLAGVVDGLDPGRQPQVARRRERHLGVEDDGEGRHPRIHDVGLDPGPVAGHPRGRRPLPARQRGGDVHLRDRDVVAARTATIFVASVTLEPP